VYGPGLDPWCDRGETIKTAAAREPHQQRFGLVVARVRGEQRGDIVRSHVITHQLVACLARGSLEACARFGSAPNQYGVTEAERGGLIRDSPRLGGRFRTQTVVDGQHSVGAGVGTPLPQPVREQHREGRTVAAAGHGQRARPVGALRKGAE
jgi:hypothetical protein